MLSHTDLLTVVSNCTYSDWKVVLKRDDTRFYIQVEDPNGTDTFTGHPLPWASRKWFVSEHMCVSEVVRTCYKAIQGAIEHEMNEKFRYKGVSIYDPHINLDNVIRSLTAMSDPLDTRDNRTTSV